MATGATGIREWDPNEDSGHQGSHAASTQAKNDRGATAVEYGLIVALIAVVIIVAVVLLGGTCSDTFERSATSV